MLQEIQRRVRQGDSFAFETTLSGRHYALLIPRWRAVSYHIKLIFLGLPTVDLAVVRVKARISQGGHNVADSVIRRRFEQGIRNFRGLYCGLVDSWVLCDNSGPDPIEIESGDNV